MQHTARYKLSLFLESLGACRSFSARLRVTSGRAINPVSAPAQVFNAAMGGYSATNGVAAINAHDFAGIGHVVDVGGGHSKMIAAILKRHPGLRGTLVDLPRVVEGAPALLGAEGVADRCAVVDGDMFAAVPAGGDLHLISHVIHNWDDTRAPEVLRSCRRAMAPGARLVILDPVTPERMQVGPVAQDHALMDLRICRSTAAPASARQQAEGAP